MPEPSPAGGSPALVRWGAVALVVCAGVVLLFAGEAMDPPLRRGMAAPPFSLASLADGGRVELADLQGRVVLLNFWATWCKPCEDEMPAMERLYRRLRDRGFELVAISVDEDRDAVVRFRNRMRLSFPIALDPSQASARRYQTLGFPESLLIDRDGRIVERYVGPRDWDHPSFAERIGELLDAQRGSGSA